MEPIQLVVGLGNPGLHFKNTRHNIGYRFLDALIKHYGFSPREMKQNKKLKSSIGQYLINGRSLLMAKPLTYVNLSGESVQLLSHYYKVKPEQILVIHDEVSLPPGQAKLKREGGTGGHNGLKHITQCLGTDHYSRLRLGIGHPGNSWYMSKFVLSPASKDENQELGIAFQNVLGLSDTILEGDFSKAMQVLHQ